jgi:N-acyl-D-amino-acid deacylase
MLDIKIINGVVVDGSGIAARESDVGVTGGLITDIGDLSQAESRKVIDATGCVVCPGFIDAHTHSDSYLLLEPSSPSKIYQGVTTEVCGNCGASAAPVTDFRHLPSDWADKEYPARWSSFCEFRELIESCGIGVNMVMLVGHNTLRRSFVGYDNRPLRSDELVLMKLQLTEAMESGARGLSTGLVYAPGMFAEQAEVVALAKVVARYGGIYASHMRSEGERLLDAIDETIAIGEQAGVRVQISHLKASGRANWHKLDAALERIRAACRCGLQIAADRYPYLAGATDLDVVFPVWASDGGRERVLARLNDKDVCCRLRQELIDSREPDYWDGVLVGSTVHPDNLRFRGEPLPAVARELGLPHAVDALLHLCRNDEMRTGAFFASMSEDNLLKVYGEDYVMVGSDASLRAVSGSLSRDYPHPRAYGTVPRFLQLVQAQGVMGLEEAVRRMTSLPADQFQLSGRGLLARGYAADIVVFAQDEFRETASYAVSHSYAVGMRHVLVNGQAVLVDGEMTAALPGEFI